MKINPTAFSGHPLSDIITLSSLNVNPGKCAHIEVQSVDPINSPLKLNKSVIIPQEQAAPYKMPEILTVKVESGNVCIYNDIYRYIIIYDCDPIKQKENL